MKNVLKVTVGLVLGAVLAFALLHLYIGGKEVSHEPPVKQESKTIDKGEPKGNTSNNTQEATGDMTKAQGNEQLQEASKNDPNHEGESNLEYAERLSNEADSEASNEEPSKYQQWLLAKQNSEELDNMSEEQRANGGGGGGSAKAFSPAGESYEEYVARTSGEK